MAQPQPFWEAAYRDASARPFGGPSDDVVEVAAQLPEGARVLDLGCGDGRHTLPLAKVGHRVEAVDVSEAAIAKLNAAAVGAGLDIDARVADLADASFTGPYDLVICHGVLHLLERPVWQRLVPELQEATAAGGWHVVVVFTDRIPSPPDLAPHTHGLFREGELEALYQDWEVTARRHTLEDEHPGGVRHRHAVNRLIARRP